MQPSAWRGTKQEGTALARKDQPIMEKRDICNIPASPINKVSGSRIKAPTSVVWEVSHRNSFWHSGASMEGRNPFANFRRKRTTYQLRIRGLTRSSTSLRRMLRSIKLSISSWSVI